ncbi:hypothetical protein A5791_23025 [Mycobacterium sp. 852002-51163_SCH5372311]|uniref:Rv1733c family protein n=1 Tax=Mycobacterium sp. 852002-51163_SCH5372311 TaxID=1834097 RepID=UPI0007FE8C30|nr:hypothetical protein [Mycobacterium sp. 852002-51163_SCH5372311]OBF85486.1 hypothetical protein A5791_23025 [Mycobacterium sp. 852002-51163_SCH5372311]
MSTPPPDHQPLAGRRPDDAMETFTVRLPRKTSVSLFGGNPLTRTSDRLQAFFLVLAVAVSLISMPVAAAVGTAVHDSRSRVYTEQAAKYRTVTATVIGTGDSRQNLERPTITVPARWLISGTEHTGDVVAPRTVQVGDTVEVWLDDDGSPVGRPSTTAVDEAVASAFAVWLGTTLSAVALYLVARMALDRSRNAAWQRGIDNLLGQR